MCDKVIRDQLTQRLPDLSEGEWALLDQDGYVAEVESGAADLDHLVDRVKLLRQTFGRPAKQEAIPEVAQAEELARRATTRAEALSALLAIDAEQDERVVAFRRRALRGRLVKPERVAQWIERHAEPPTDFVIVARGQPLEHFRRVLDYAAPPSTVAQHVEVAHGSTLDRLRALSDSLANRYAWQPAQASLFVLTALVPILPPVRSRTMHRVPVAAASRVALDVDPTVTPRELAQHYAAARKRILSGRSRRMSEKHLRLAIYAATQEEGTWDDRMRGWNDAHPEARYRESSNFQRDAAKAVKRLLDPL